MKVLRFGSDAHHASLHQCCVHLICFMFLICSSLQQKAHHIQVTWGWGKVIQVFSIENQNMINKRKDNTTCEL